MSVYGVEDDFFADYSAGKKESSQEEDFFAGYNSEAEQKQGEPSGYGADIVEGTKDIGRAHNQFLKGSEEATDTKAAAETYDKASSGEAPSVLANMLTPGQRAEIAEGKSQGVGTQESLDTNRDARVKNYQEMIDKWAADPTYSSGDETFEQWKHGLVRMIPQFTAQVGIGIATGGTASAAFMGSQIAGSDYEDNRKNGADPVTAFKAAMLDAAVQAPMEKMGLESLLSKWNPKKTIVKKLMDTLGAMATEGGTEWAQKYPELATKVWAETEGKGMSFSERMDKFVDGLGKATKEGIFEGSIAATLGGGVHVVTNLGGDEKAPKNPGEQPPTKAGVGVQVTQEQAPPTDMFADIRKAP